MERDKEMTSSSINRITAGSPLAQSESVVTRNVARLREVFPEVIGEGADGLSVDFDALRQLLGDRAIAQTDEKYGLNWHGKRNARLQSLAPTSATLRPCPATSREWDTTQNLLIEGDNLEVLKVLQRSYSRRVKLIYIDPPYNTGNDLLYPNDFQDGIRAYLEVTGQMEGGLTMSSNPEAGGRYHTNWLNMMYPRLRLARGLLAKDGVIVCTIDENEVTNLGSLLKEVFEEGSYDHVCISIVHNPRGIQGTNFSYTHEYAYFVFPRGTKAIVDRKLAAEDITWSQFRNWGTESERTDAKNCFYPVIVREDVIVGFGPVSADDEHPAQTEMRDGLTHVYPIDRSGVERKWRYARQSVDAIAHLLRARRTAEGYEIEIGKDFGTYRTVWTDKRYDANEYGTKILKALVPDSPFTFPKSLWSVYDCVQAVTGNDPNAIVVDFFAGSGTTGHAVWELNKNDGGSRRFILVQLPEPIAGNGPYKTIADVTRTRLHAASTAFADESPLLEKDLGFRVFKLDSSNIVTWEPNAEDVERSLLDHLEHVKPDRSEADLLYELLLRMGLDLCVPIEVRRAAGKVVQSVGGGVLIACLATEISAIEAEPLAQAISDWHNELLPAGGTTCVFRDSAFSDDVTKSNLASILHQNGITNVRSL